MRKDIFIGELAARMARLGWPGRPVRRIMQEIGDHWDELEQEGREGGMDEAAAADFARQRLGDPKSLLDTYEHTMRTASWAGRHPIISFVVLPPLALALWFLCWTLMAARAHELYAQLLKLDTPRWGHYLMVFFGAKVIHYTGALAVPALFWWWARTSFRNFNWRWIACGICALHGLFNHVTVRPNQLLWGYDLAPVDWLSVLAPLFVAAVAHAWERPGLMRTLMVTFACVMLVGCASSKVPQERGWIGGEYRPANQLKRSSSGLLITALRTNTPAARSGLREGDLILRAAGKPINNPSAFQEVIDAAQPGSNVPIKIFRDGAVLDVDVRAGRETFTPTCALVIGLLMSREWDPWPNPDFSLIALGYKRQQQRLELDSPESRFKRSQNETPHDDPPSVCSSEGWEIWLPVISFSSRKRILEQSDVEAGP